METTPLNAWILRKIGASGNNLTQNDLRGYQLNKLRETIDYACVRSPFYSRRLSRFSINRLAELAHLGELPFTTAQDICSNSLITVLY